MSAADTLKNLAILSDWTLEERLMMAARMEAMQVAAGTALLTEGQPADSAYILETGRLRILSRGEILGVVDTVACFGEISCLLPGTPVTATVMAESACTVYRISKDDLAATAQRVPKLWRSLFAQISDRLRRANKRLAEILDHSPQGFLKLDRNARVTNEYSKKCVDYLGHNPVSGFSLPELLHPGDPASAASWQSVFGMVFEDVGVPLSDLFDLLTPEARIEGNGVLRDLRLEFHPIYGDDRRVVAVDVGIEDVTRERELERAGQLERARQATLGKIYQNPDSFFSLLRLIDEVDALCAAALAAWRSGAVPDANALARLMRELHSLKGFAGNFGLAALRQAAHELETAFGQSVAGGAAIDAAAVAGLDEAFAALQSAGAEGKALKALIDPSLLLRLEGVVLLPAQLEAMRAALVAGDVAAASGILQAAESVEVKQLFACWPNDIERLCKDLGKEARLELYGVGGMVPKPVFNALDRVLVHALNNAMDHGLEDPETRLCAEKDTEGAISVMVEVGADELAIEIADDGRGSDFISAVASARENPAIDPKQVDAAVAAGEPWRVLLMPGFSTAAMLTDLSGRGVGLDAVAAAVAELGGEIGIDSTPGQGFMLRLKVPLAGPAPAPAKNKSRRRKA
jgi:two-component system chemotaxis sensor kinase CheA